jgi:hypothetical protein
MPKKKQLKETACPSGAYWERRTPCWEMMKCPEPIHSDCPAYRNRGYPCWEIEGTYCKWNEWGANGRDTSLCLKCEVYVKYGEGQHIVLKLRGVGLKLLID